MSDARRDELSRALSSVREQIASAAKAAGREPSSVTLVAVSKTRPAEDVRLAWELGQRDFGENYVQELVGKHEALAACEGLRWHMIGGVQRNKAKFVAATTSMAHTVDSVELARELGRRAGLLGRVIPVLVQVNVGREAQKGGCEEAELPALLDAIEGVEGVALRGLMTVPPHTEDPAGARPFFEALASLREANGGRARLPELSMGMTHDLDVAVACGATIVRIGTAIFGAR